ncbi:MAG: DUF427 domain-containing protein [Polyangiales bacterium]
MDQDDLERARAMWRYRGTGRPSFAVDPAPGQESVWDYPRPPRMEADARHVRVLYRDTLIASSTASVRILETAGPPVFYLPRQDAHLEHLVARPGGSLCEWKGAATYWSLQWGGQEIPDVGWSYEDPFAPYESIRGYVSFYPAKLDCYLDDERVGAQPGGFYGGWVTREIVGPFKGEPGTGGW